MFGNVVALVAIGLERHGRCPLCDRGLTPTPPYPKPPPWAIRAIKRTAARNRLVKRYHPDLGGSDDAMARINAAFDVAKGTLRSRQNPKILGRDDMEVV